MAHTNLLTFKDIVAVLKILLKSSFEKTIAVAEIIFDVVFWREAKMKVRSGSGNFTKNRAGLLKIAEFLTTGQINQQIEQNLD